MPSEVALTSTPASRERSTRSAQSKGLTRAPKWRATASARSRRAVEEAHFGSARLEEGVDHAAGGAAGAEHRGRRSTRIEIGDAGAQMAHEAGGIRVVGDEPAVLEPQRVGRPHSARRRHGSGRCGVGRLLVRNRDIAAGKAMLAHAAENAATSPGRTGRRS